MTDPAGTRRGRVPSGGLEAGRASAARGGAGLLRERRRDVRLVEERDVLADDEDVADLLFRLDVDDAGNDDRIVVVWSLIGGRAAERWRQ